MVDQARNGPAPSILWPGIVVAALGLYGYLSYKPKLETSRPKGASEVQRDDKSAARTEKGHYARLWEDPLGNRYRKLLRARDVNVRQPPFDSSPPRAFADLGADQLALPVLLDGGVDTNAAESRMRTRYAVVAALTTAKYRPLSSDRMEYLELSLAEDAVDGDSESKCIFVPYERFKPDLSDPLYDADDSPHFSDVIVCWLDENELGDRPLHGIASLADRCLWQSREREFWNGLIADWGTAEMPQKGLSVLGPSGSDGLIKMACEDHEHNSELRRRLWAREVTVYSPRATVEPEALKVQGGRLTFDTKRLVKEFVGSAQPSVIGIGANSTVPDKSRPAGAASVLPDLIKKWRGRCLSFQSGGYRPNVRFASVVGTDWHLAHALRGELQLRRAWPKPNRADECVVLITEKDTLYGRAVPFLFSCLIPSQDRSIRLTSVVSSGKAGEAAKLEFEFEAPEGGDLEAMEFEGNVVDGYLRGSMKRRGRATGDSRDVRGHRHSFFQSGDEARDPGDGIQLWDVQFGREGDWRFARMRVNTKTGNGSWRSIEPLVVYKYVRGIDGMESSSGPTLELAREDEAKRTERTSGYLPEGTSQLDYLRRMEQELTELHSRQRKIGGRGILAIGVMGTDVYDKLLVLRALRKRFPNVVFFTTDLDANLTRLTELEYTRNLLVATHFGLKLHPSLQRDVPPFRRSYQTATFLATLWAVHDDRVRDILGPAFETDSPPRDKLWPTPSYVDETGAARKWPVLDRTPDYDTNKSQCLQPLIYEIGLNGAYQLTKTGGYLPACPAFAVPASAPDDAGLAALVHPPSPREIPAYPARCWWLLGINAAVLATLLCLNLTAARKMFGVILEPFRRGIALLVSLVQRVWSRLGVHANAEDEHENENPVAKSGAKAAPSQDPSGSDRHRGAWVRDAVVVAGVIAVVLLCTAIYRDHGAVGGEPFELYQGVSVWPTALIRLAVIILSVASIWIGIVDLQKNLVGQSERWLEFDPLAILDSSKPSKEPGSTDSWITRSWDAWKRVRIYDWDTSQLDDKELLMEYSRRGKPENRLLRSAALATLYIIFAGTLFAVTDRFPNFPARGSFAFAAGTVVLWLSVIMLTGLVFFVIDATHLCQRFVVAVRERDKESDELATVRFLGERTHVVGKLMLYPFTALLLMIFARHPILDNWNIPWPLILVMFFLFLVMVIHSLVLRREARRARQGILDQLREKLRKAASNSREKYRLLIEEIERQNRGAFRPLTDDYVFRALAIPFGGTGGLLLIDQLLPTML